MMDPFLQKQMEEVFAENDRLRAEDDLWQAKWEARRREQQRASGEIIRKTYEPQQQQMTSAEMDRKIAAALHRFKRDLTQAVGGAISSIRKEWLEEIKKSLDDFQPQLPSIEGWQPRHYLKGSVVVSGGGTYQAREDTAFPPGHHSWVCLAAPGLNGQDGRDGRDWDGHKRGDVVDLPNWRDKRHG